ncbi:MAG: protein kinase [Planctomycetes bacterium]|nr:protein kinase [Planctomycetota bacterium]
MTDPSQPSGTNAGEEAPTTPPGRDSAPDLGETRGQPTEPAAPLEGGALGALPRRFGRYQLQRELGKGGMGTVYLAHDPVLDIPVAIKLPHPEVVRDGHALERFYREARAAARLQHPNVCRVYDVGFSDGRHYLAMAYIDGEPLSSRVADFTAEARRAVELVQKLALTLEEAHRQGIIHRDLKPANIMLDRRGEPIVMDFGLARRDPSGARSDESSYTRQGVIIGTPAYMPPEQATGDVAAMGPGCDVYSLGVILYELLAGRVPFQGPTTAVLVQVVHDDPPPPSAYRPDLDRRLEAICLKAMGKKPVHRFASMAAFATALDEYLQAGPSSPPPAEPGPADSQRPSPEYLDALLASLRRLGWPRGVRDTRGRLGELDPAQRLACTLLLDWLEGDDRLHEEGLERIEGQEAAKALTAWALTGQGLAKLEQFDDATARQFLDRAAAFERHLRDTALKAHLNYLEGYLLARQGLWGDAVPLLHEALSLFGGGHFMTGAVLNCLGRVYAGKCNFDAAREFYQQALRCKREAGDETGLLLSHEEAGRLFYDWGRLDRAEEVLQAGLRLAQRAGDAGAQAQLFNHLGRVALVRADKDFAAGKKPSARRHLAKAREYIDWSVVYNQRHGRAVQEGRVRKDAALLCLAEGNHEGAEAHLRRAEEVLQQARFERGLAEVRRVRARLLRERGFHQEALPLLRQALAHYDQKRAFIEATRTQFEVARTLAEDGAATRLVVEALQDALQRAEACRRGDLVERIEEELRGVDEEAHWRHVFRRVRGHGSPEGTASLSSGISEPATVLFLNLKGFVPFCQGMDPEQVMLTLNQLLADLEGVLERCAAQVTAYLGGGFMALLREAGHAERAVSGALDLLQVLEEFNRPRDILGLPLLPAKIGVASGVVFLGNIGTYRKLDFSGVGVPVNLAARLMRQADVTAPCISQETRELVGERFVYRAGGPRLVDLPGIGQRQVWDVVGRSAKQPTGLSAR